MSTPLERWVEEQAAHTRPKNIHWCDGSDAESAQLNELMLRDGTFTALNEKTYPNCFYSRSNPNDVARTEQVTFICSGKKEDAGPTNNWLSPADAKAKVGPLFKGCMEGRTMYVVPYIMGPVSSPISKVGVQLTDSAYVAANMRIMTRMGKVATERLGSSAEFVPGLHSLGDVNPDRRFICHFPEEKLIWSFGSGYGGNALLGKKCFALRIASAMAREQGWMAEHMLILGLEDPAGKITYLAAAFPSACGKTNLAMMVSALESSGYKVWTVGDDISWMQIGPDGYLHAINPEAGFFGVAPGTSAHTNPNVMEALRKNSIFTNVGLTANREPWWEGIGLPHGDGMIDWQGQPYDPKVRTAAHPNSRYTVPAHQAPCISKRWEDPAGVPISAFIFGGRRTKTVPLVFEAFDWPHGVFVGATMGSETTAAATGAVGVLRRDPMAMLPFCGYNMADYWGHWLAMGRRIPHPPKIFHVNWFRKGSDGKFLWPGYGENVRVLKWILERAEGKGKAVETPIGFVPAPDALTLDGLNVTRATMEALLRVDPAEFAGDLDDIKTFFDKFGTKLPAELRAEHAKLGERLSRVLVAQK
ncbi:MAG: phosphoenolpyruvate carboxykinase (GTP) [Acidobacteria bacterium]|nr:phosphoenolpyruvate carboxykinase (GTP) [Acidobacteriota bacterium]MCL5286849.1 phosphoenolpyruvate carboxykinase (GTP) [Acidobacteriota bacterium]